MDHQTGGDDVRRSAESTVSTIAEQAQQTAEATISTQKDQAAGALHSVAEAVRQSGDQLRQDQPQLASIANQAADRVDQASDYIRQHDVRDFVRVAEDFARREPLIFLGGAFAVGFLASRFLKASSPSRGGSMGRRDSSWYDAGSNARLSGYGSESAYGAGGRGAYGGAYGSAYGDDYRERSMAGTDSLGEQETLDGGIDADDDQQALGQTVGGTSTRSTTG